MTAIENRTFFPAAFSSCEYHGPKGHCSRSFRSNMQMKRIIPPRITNVSLDQDSDQPVSRSPCDQRAAGEGGGCVGGRAGWARPQSDAAHIAMKGPMYFWFLRMNGFGLSGPHLDFWLTPLTAASPSARASSAWVSRSSNVAAAARRWPTISEVPLPQPARPARWSRPRGRRARLSPEVASS